jgi:hypothetical protein
VIEHSIFFSHHKLPVELIPSECLHVLAKESTVYMSTVFFGLHTQHYL